MTTPQYNGAHIDERPVEEKKKDFLFHEIVSAPAPVAWVEKKPEDWRKFPIFDQDGSGSCVAQTAAKLLGVMYKENNEQDDYVHFSATHIYQRRANKPKGGMGGVDCFEIMKKGVTLESLVPSQKLSDAKMDAVKIAKYKEDVGAVFKIGNYVSLPIKDIDTIASTIQETGKAVMVWFYFKHEEWTAQPTVKIKDLELRGEKTSRHSVTAVDFTMYKGKKCLIIEDSWGPKAGNGAGQRIIDEDFFKARNFFAGYAINFKFIDSIDESQPVSLPKPKYTFTKTLHMSGSIKKGDADVVALQECLQYLGLYPSNVECTGYFGAVTKKAVEKFQAKYGLTVDGIAGPNTIAQLNSLFA